MTESHPSQDANVTGLLTAWGGGDEGAVWEEGRAMTLNRVAEYALSS